MAGLDHLEKMGKELKCPICWSLLKSAVSLACNHIFCNSCILQSMKSVSDCPVCKVPFARREVRAAPHMDNLASIYKSMEVAAGTNILSTQIAPLAANSVMPKEGLAHGNVKKDLTVPETTGQHQRKPKRKGSSKQKEKKEKAVSVQYNHFASTKPSFPAKKRIHVTPYPVSETTVRQQNVSKLGDACTEFKENSRLVTNKKKETNDQADPLLSPFFWLREEDEVEDENADKPSQTTETPPYDAPCFSDIKDSYEEAATKTTPTSISNVAEAFDSEMFEWTQKASSPEICSTPKKKLSLGMKRLCRIKEKENQEGTKVAVASGIEVLCGNAKTSRSHAKRRIPRKKRRQNSVLVTMNTYSSVKRMRSTVTHDANDGIPSNYGEIAANLIQENEDAENKRPKLSECTKNTRSLTSQTDCYNVPSNHINVIAPAGTSEQSPTLCRKLQEKNTRKGEAFISNRSKKMLSKTNYRSQGKRIRTSRVDDLVVIPELKENSIGETEAPKLSSVVNSLDFPMASCQKNKNAKRIETELLESIKTRRKNPKLGGANDQMIKNQAAHLPESKDADHMNATSFDMAASKSNQTAVGLHHESKITFPVKSLTKIRGQNSLNDTLRKCEKTHSQILCAFCHTSTDTKDSGEMMHYFNEKPVSADFNGGNNVIHAHKYCTEWAPNVYFDGELIINLTAELARSRRIKCSCCGIKGAALGCYDKSCRKSFHLTCAKSMPECRWDTENYVMLCPLHLTQKLPSETSYIQRKSKRRSTREGSSQALPKSETSQDLSQMWTWPTGSSCKWVLCCSALSGAEKELIHRFAKLAGVSISNTWIPEVTHVIASTDENGACRRTLKILKGILDGKWILRFDWIGACIEAMKPIDEEKFEITLDVHGIREGPRLGRLRVINKEPKLFNCFKFYFCGEYTASYKGYLQDLVIVAGGAVLQRKPISRGQARLSDDSFVSKLFIVYSLELPDKLKCKNDAVVFHRRQAEAKALADASGGEVATNTWIIDSIAACKLQPLP